MAGTARGDAYMQQEMDIVIFMGMTWHEDPTVLDDKLETNKNNEEEEEDYSFLMWIYIFIAFVVASVAC